MSPPFLLDCLGIASASDPTDKHFFGCDKPPCGGLVLAIYLEQRLEFTGESGATRRIRTDDLLITNQLLYQLS
jgi:hypothetical protein